MNLYKYICIYYLFEPKVVFLVLLGGSDRTVYLCLKGSTVFQCNSNLVQQCDNSNHDTVIMWRQGIEKGQDKTEFN